MSAKRFSKAVMRDLLERRMRVQALRYSDQTGRQLDPGNGYAQCKADPMAMYIYGEWVALKELLEEL